MIFSFLSRLRQKYTGPLEMPQQKGPYENPLAEMMRERAARCQEHFTRVVSAMLKFPEEHGKVASRVQQAAKSIRALAYTLECREELKAGLWSERLKALSLTDDFGVQYRILLRDVADQQDIKVTQDIVLLLTMQDAFVMLHFASLALTIEFGHSSHAPGDRMVGARFQSKFPFGSPQYDNLLGYLHILRRNTEDFESMMKTFHAQSFAGPL